MAYSEAQIKRIEKKYKVKYDPSAEDMYNYFGPNYVFKDRSWEQKEKSAYRRGMKMTEHGLKRALEKTRDKTRQLSERLEKLKDYVFIQYKDKSKRMTSLMRDIRMKGLNLASRLKANSEIKEKGLEWAMVDRGFEPVRKFMSGEPAGWMVNGKFVKSMGRLGG